MNPFGIYEIQEQSKKIDSIPNVTKAFEKNCEIKKPKYISTINESLDGQKYAGTNVEYRKRVFILDEEAVEGVFPVFDSKFDTSLPKELCKSSDTEQFKYCINQLSKELDRRPELAEHFTARQLEQIRNGEPRISGLTWHHNEVPGKMQLVDATEHAICRHTGGRSIWGGGSECR